MPNSLIEQPNPLLFKIVGVPFGIFRAHGACAPTGVTSG